MVLIYYSGFCAKFSEGRPLAKRQILASLNTSREGIASMGCPFIPRSTNGFRVTDDEIGSISFRFTKLAAEPSLLYQNQSEALGPTVPLASRFPNVSQRPTGWLVVIGPPLL